MRIIPSFLAAVICVTFAASPSALLADTGITASTSAATSPTLAIMSHFAGSYTCTITPGNATFAVVGTMSPNGKVFRQVTGTTEERFANSKNGLTMIRTDDAGGFDTFLLSTFAPGGIDLTFASTIPGEAGGSSATQTFTPTFELKRFVGSYVVTKKSPQTGPVTETCKTS